jgi:hypothetical protein
MERREYDVVLVPEAEGGFSVFVPDGPRRDRGLPRAHARGGLAGPDRPP